MAVFYLVTNTSPQSDKIVIVILDAKSYYLIEKLFLGVKIEGYIFVFLILFSNYTSLTLLLTY